MRFPSEAELSDQLLDATERVGSERSNALVSEAPGAAHVVDPDDEEKHPTPEKYIGDCVADAVGRLSWAQVVEVVVTPPDTIVAPLDVDPIARHAVVPEQVI